MQTQSILGSKLLKICISFLHFKHFMPSCYTYMTWLLHNVTFTAAAARSSLLKKILISKSGKVWSMKLIRFLSLTIQHLRLLSNSKKSRKCVCGKVWPKHSSFEPLSLTHSLILIYTHSGFDGLCENRWFFTWYWMTHSVVKHQHIFHWHLVQ